MHHQLGRLLAAILPVAVAVPVSAAALSTSVTNQPRAAAVATPSPATPTGLALPLAPTDAHDQQLPEPPSSGTSPDAVVSPDPATAEPATPEASETPTSTRQPAAAEAVEASTPAPPAPPAPPAKETPPAPSEEPAKVSLSKTAARLLELLNAERRAAGLRTLEPAGDLVRIARNWSEEMSSTGIFKHNPNLTGQLCCRSAFGENVAWGGVPDGWLMESTDGIHRNFMRSSGHRANILDPRFDQVGIGTVVANGKIWVTQVFRRHAG